MLAQRRSHPFGTDGVDREGLGLRNASVRVQTVHGVTVQAEKKNHIKTRDRDSLFFSLIKARCGGAAGGTTKEMWSEASGSRGTDRPTW